MASGAPDYTQAATIASGTLQAVGGATRDKFKGTAGAAPTTLTPTAGRTVMQWTIKNEGGADMDVWQGSSDAGDADMRLEPGQSWSPVFNGPLTVRRVSTDTTYRASNVEV